MVRLALKRKRRARYGDPLVLPTVQVGASEDHMNVQYDFEYVNPAAQRVSGLSDADMDGKDIPHTGPRQLLSSSNVYDR